MQRDCVRWYLDVFVSTDSSRAEVVLVFDQSQTWWWILSQDVSPGSSAVQAFKSGGRKSKVFNSCFQCNPQTLHHSVIE